MTRRKRDDVARAERLERSLFRAARAYRPPASTRLRALAVVAAVSTSATGGAAAAAATAATTGAASAPIGLAATLVSKAGGTTWLSMWLGALLVTAGSVGYVAVGGTSADPPPGRRATEATSTSASTSMPGPARHAEDLDAEARAPNLAVEAPAAGGPPEGAPPPPAAVASSAARFAPRSPVGAAVAVPTPSASTTTLASPAPTSGAAPADELAAEIEMLDRARAHLAAGQPGEARAELRRRESRFPRGRLGLEAQLIDMEALVRSGQRHEARVLARAFLDAHPNHLLAGRVRGLVGLDAGPTP